MNNIGITIIIVILVPILFQVILGGIRSRRQHRQIMDRLTELESRLKD